MNNQSLQLSKKQMTGIVLFFCLLIVVGFFATNSIVVIKSSHNKTVDIELSRTNSENIVNSFELEKGSRLMVLPKGDYVINAREKNKQSTYMKKLKGFSYTSIDVTLSSQKQSSLLGVSSLGCAIDYPKENRSVFYKCNPYTSSQNILEITEDNQPPHTITMSSLSALSTNIPHEGVDHSESLGSVIKPYLNGFLYAVAGGGNITFYRLDSSGNKIGDPVVVNNFKSTIDNSSFATSQNISDTSFSVLDRDEKRVLVFNKLNTAASREINVSDLLQNNDESTVSEIFHSSKNIYLSILRNPTMLEYHDDEGHTVDEIEEEVQTSIKQQSINIIQFNQSSEIESIKIPDNLTIRKASINGSGELILIPQRDSTSKEILLVDGKKLKKLTFATNEIQEVCWLDDNTLTYSTQDTDNTSRVFSFSTSGNMSRLLYENYSSAITGLFCNNSSLTFSVRSDSDGLLDEATYYSLVDESNSSTQLSTILPVYIDLPEYQTLLKIEQHRTGVKASLVVEPDNKPSTQLIEQKIRQELSDKGVSDKKIPILIDL